MSLQIILPWLLIGVLMSAITMVFGVSRGDASFTMLSAAGFAGFILVISYVTNRYYWHRARALTETTSPDAVQIPQRENEAVDIARRNAKFFATCYVWGGVALLAIYSLTQLHWQHGWEYAVGMLALSIVSLSFAGLLAQKPGAKRSRVLHLAVILTAIQAVCSALGLIYLIGSGKLASTRADWAANYVFLFGGIAILLLSLIALRSDRLLKA